MMGPGMWGGGVMALIWLVALAAIIIALVQRRDIDLGRRPQRLTPTGQTAMATTRTGSAATEGRGNLMTERTVVWIVLGVLAVLLLGPLLGGLAWGGGWGPGWMTGPGMMGRPE